MTDRADIEDLDLLALADGHLDQDPIRKAELEAAVGRCPRASARLSDYRAQTAALRAACAGVLAEPVPERLYAIVEGMDRPRDRPMARYAAAVLLMVAAGLGGWMVGQDDDDPARQALIDESYRAFVLRGADHMPQLTTTAAADIQGRLFSWVDKDIGIRLSAPDLSSEGFALVGKRFLSQSAGQIAALEYVAPGGSAFTLFIAPRWENQPGPIREEERDGVTLTYWHDGPLTSSIATRLSRERARELAETVRNAMREETTTPPVAIQQQLRALETPADGLVADTQIVPHGADPNEQTHGGASATALPN